MLNSLPGEAIPASLALLRPFGRFLEIGKVDIYQNRLLGMYPFQNNLSFSSIDLDRMIRERPQIVPRDVPGADGEIPRAGLPAAAAHGVSRRGSCRRIPIYAARKNTGKVIVSVAACKSADHRQGGTSAAVYQR